MLSVIVGKNVSVSTLFDSNEDVEGLDDAWISFLEVLGVSKRTWQDSILNIIVKCNVKCKIVNLIYSGHALSLALSIS